jgi:hypothetical protein
MPAIRIQTCEVATGAQHQFLIHGSPEAMMALFDIAVLVAISSLDLLRRQTVVAQQTFIAVGELRRPHRVVDRRRKPIRAVPLRYLAQFPQRILQTLAQALEALRETHRTSFPVRVRQHEVIYQVRRTLPLDGHAQLFHVREVRGADAAARRTPREMELPLLASASPSAAACATGHPENAQDRPAADVQIPSSLQGRGCFQKVSGLLPIHR